MLAVLAASLAATVGGAHASSILVLGASTSTPSIVRLDAAEPAKTASLPSIVALGEPVPDVSGEKVAAIPENSRHGPRQEPMVIRGGIVGGASATPAAQAAPAKAATAPTAEGKPAADGKAAPTATASNSKPQPEQKPKPQPQPAAEQPAPIPPAEKAM